MMKKSGKWFSRIALFLAGTVAVQAQLPSYEYKRSIENITTKGWYVIPIPPAVLAKANLPLNDLRIYEISAKDTTEVPYILDILDRKRERQELPMMILNQSHRQGNTYITLKATNRPEINRIQLELSEQNFDGFVAVEGSMDQIRWFTIVDNQRLIRFHNDYIHYDYTEVTFNLSNYAFYRLQIQPGYSSRTTRVLRATVFREKDEQGVFDELRVVRKEIKQNTENKQTEILVQLSQRFMLSQMELVLTHGKDYYRVFEAYYRSGVVSAPAGEIEQWTPFYNGIVSSVEPNRFQNFRIQSDRLKIIIHNRDDQPVTVQDVKLWCARVQLKAELEPGRNYILVYGKPYDRAPQYDVVYFKEKIPATFHTATLGSEQLHNQTTEAPVQPWFTSTGWIWSIMTIVIIILGYFSYRMIKDAKKL